MDFAVAEKAALKSMDKIFQVGVNCLLSQKVETQADTVKVVTLADTV